MTCQIGRLPTNVMMKLKIIFYFGLITLVLGEELVDIEFRCVDQSCSVPIRSMKVRQNYNPDHKLKMSVKLNDVVSVYGESNDTDLLLLKARPDVGKEEPYLVPKSSLSNMKGKEKAAKISVKIPLPSNFAKTKRHSQSKSSNSSFTEKSMDKSFKSEIDERNVPKTADIVPSPTPRVTHGESPYGKASNADNSTEKEEAAPTEIEDDFRQVNDYYDELTGIKSSSEDSTQTNNVETLPSGMDEKPILNDTTRKPDAAGTEMPPQTNSSSENIPPENITSSSSPSKKESSNVGKPPSQSAVVNDAPKLKPLGTPTSQPPSIDTNITSKPSDVSLNPKEKESSLNETVKMGSDSFKGLADVENVTSSLAAEQQNISIVSETAEKEKGTILNSTSKKSESVVSASTDQVVASKEKGPATNVGEKPQIPRDASSVKVDSKVANLSSDQEDSTKKTSELDEPNKGAAPDIDRTKSSEEKKIETNVTDETIIPSTQTTKPNQTGSSTPEDSKDKVAISSSTLTKPEPNASSVKVDSKVANLSSDQENSTKKTLELDEPNKGAAPDIDRTKSSEEKKIETNVTDETIIPSTQTTKPNQTRSSTPEDSKSQLDISIDGNAEPNSTFVKDISNVEKPVGNLVGQSVVNVESESTQESIPRVPAQKGFKQTDNSIPSVPDNEVTPSEKERAKQEEPSDSISAPDFHQSPAGIPTTTFEQPVPEKTSPMNVDFTKTEQSPHPETLNPNQSISESDTTSFDESNTSETVDRSIEEELPFYATTLEYFSSLSDSIPSFHKWFAKDETQNEFCSSEKDCDGVIIQPMEGVDVDLDLEIRGIHNIQIPFWGEITSSEKEWIITYIAIFSLTIFLASAILSMFRSGQWKKKEKNLVALVNRLEGKLLVSTKEISTLEEQINDVKTMPVGGSLSAEKREALKEAFNRQLKQYQEKNGELEDKVTYLEKELESVSNYALEMHKLFENSLTTQSTSRAAIDEVDELRTLAEKQENEIEDLRREMESVIIENQILKETNESTKSSLKKLEQDFNAQMKKNLELSERQKELTFKLEKETDNNLTLENDYKSQIYQLRSKLEEVELKLKRSEFQVEEMNRVISLKQGEGASDASDDDVQLRIQLTTLEAINKDLTTALKEEKNARRMVEDHMGAIIKELNSLKKSFETSEKERSEAVTKLQVLNDYFNNEKTRIHKELEAKEKLLAENESKDQLLSRTLQSLKEEINNFKSQNEALKKEINDQEVSYKIQLAKAEQKGRDDWLAFRKIERKYKECQQEAASLRNRILILESNMDRKDEEKNGTGMNGDLTVPPAPLPFPLMPTDMLAYSDFIPPPSPPLPSHSLDFEPPMPPFYSPDERLPPLGGRRIPSPPPLDLGDDDDFTPPPPIPGFLSNRSRNEMSSSYMRTTPPAGRHRSGQFKPQRQRNSVDSPSSGMSMESLDKSTR